MIKLKEILTEKKKMGEKGLLSTKRMTDKNQHTENRKMLSKLLYISDSIGALLLSAKNFSNHLSGLHEMETFYGDETLGGLIKHSKQVVEDIKEFEDIYTLTNDGLEEDEEQE